MIEKTITYTDFFGNEQTDTFYFHLGVAQLTEMELTAEGMGDYIKQIIATEDVKEIWRIFRDLLSKSVGTRSPDGKRFIRDENITADFMETNAFDEFFVELMNADYAAEFIHGILPHQIIEKMEEQENKEYSDEELLAMDDEQFTRIVGHAKNMDRRNLVVAMRRRNQRTTDQIHDVAVKKGVLN
jgi:hypothetical protein